MMQTVMCSRTDRRSHEQLLCLRLQASMMQARQVKSDSMHPRTDMSNGSAMQQ